MSQRSRAHPEVAARRRRLDAELAAARLGRPVDPRVPLPEAPVSGGRVPELVALLGTALAFEPRPAHLPEGAGLLAQVAAALAACQVRTRPLTLHGSWWRVNVPPMVVLHEGQLAVLLPGRLFLPELHRPDAQPVPVDEGVAAGIDSRALEVIRPLPDRPVSVAETLRLSLRWTGPDMALAALAALGVGLISLAVPAATSLVFNEIVPSGATGRLAVVIAVLVALAFAAAALAYTSTTHLVRLSDAIEVSTSSSVLDRVMRLPASMLRRWSSAELAGRVLIASSLQEALNQGISVGLLALILAVLNGMLMVVLVPKLGALGLIAGILLLAGKLLLVRLEQRRMATELDELDRTETVTVDLLRGWTPVRMTDGEVAGFGRWAAAFSRYRLAYNRRWGMEIWSGVATAGVLGLATVLLVVVVYRMPAGSLTSGTFLAFLTAFTQFGAGIAGLILTIGAIAQMGPTVSRLRPLLDMAPEVDVAREDPGVLEGDIEVRRLGFRYSEDLPWVLRDVSFTVPAGSLVGIVGTSGSGKSTLLRLMLGFEEPRTGSVAYDGADLASLDPGAVRRQFGVVLQSSLLLPGTIRENVTVASGPLADSRIWELLDQVSAGDTVRAMPLGLDTPVDEGSTLLSGGQRQRLLLARALARTPAVLFLDEATSALDNLTQEAVTRSIAGLGVTRVVIAHRLSTIRQADCIVVLDEGRAVEQGTYDELMAAGGLFAALVERQEL